MDRPDLQRLFSACDVNKSGKIEYEDFTVVCRELNVPNTEVKTLFNKFDIERVGYVDFGDFLARFNEVSETLDFTALGEVQHGRSAWDEFEDTMEGDTSYLGGAREQLAELYQQIHSTSDIALLRQCETVIKTLVKDCKDQVSESQQLETSLRRVEEMTSRQLTELEEDLQEQLLQMEKRVRAEEQQRMEAAMSEMQTRHEGEVADLRATVQRLMKHQEESQFGSPRVDVRQLRKQIRETGQENEALRSSLLGAQTSVSILQAELDQLKNEYADERLQHERENSDLKKMLAECQSYSSHIGILQEVNRKLYDSNDGLRSALAMNAATAKRRLSPKDETPTRKLRSVPQSTRNCSIASEDEAMSVDSTGGQYSHVTSWAERYLDGRPSPRLGMADGSSSEYDSDNTQDSVETVHRSCSYTPSDIEMSDLKAEDSVSMAPSKTSSVASSIRRRLSAFTSKHVDVDTPISEEPSPMYRLVLAGDAGSGKSSFLLRLSSNEFKGDMQSTLGVDFQIKRMLVDGEKTHLQIWDTAGQERFRSLARSYFRRAHGVILLYDVTSETSFLSVREWMNHIQDSTDERLPTCLIGNKADLRAALPEGGCVSAADGEKLAKTYNALFCETSAKEGTNVVEAVLHLAREVKKHAKLRRMSDPRTRLSLTNEKKKALSSCCGV
ncbi:ras and EF-hand domain-containing protein isoform X1 [Anguilla anguilla]|uniref:EF-hand domain-containing protein n=1 Tax=Anguilla anguilla TaxID=7936 RepID=A0A9D3M0R0_ANGAN|nr:ras and EF-hand domain-containing protein isoform X1 [Anguilla anguilla]KAG5839647.1 hypothetical protein ANANG_G00207130 [Anguilla anguilla]